MEISSESHVKTAPAVASAEEDGDTSSSSSQLAQDVGGPQQAKHEEPRGWRRWIRRYRPTADAHDVDEDQVPLASPAADGTASYQKIDTDESTLATVAFPEKQPRCSRRLRLAVAGVVVVLVIAASTIATLVGRQSSKDTSNSMQASFTPPTRVRRSWKTFTEDDKQLYLGAVQLAMEKGYHYRFVEVHTAHMNRITSHGACPFLLWHRRFILGYENMLRSLHPKYANLTLPYWNYFQDTSTQLSVNESCNSLESCSQFLRDMGGGGKSDGPAGESMQIAHVSLEIGTCVSKGIAGHACNHVNGTASGKCRNCVMRGNWSNPHKIVQTLGPDLLRVLRVFNESVEADGYYEGPHAYMSRYIETTFHNAVHTTLNSSMRYTSSAFDPVFMGHHGMVDLAHFIFNRCRYDPSSKAKTLEWTAERDKRFDVFMSCSVYEDLKVVNEPKGNESMQMDFNSVPVEKDEFMKQFFSGYGNRYADIANVEDLGPENSYTKAWFSASLYVSDPAA
ncbi:hypothetical protein ATCC90586_000396 [Pythium insidiosum]|nr:hypothetical protein ATCC90586_000396 [Pythium insidiosum]